MNKIMKSVLASTVIGLVVMASIFVYQEFIDWTPDAKPGQCAEMSAESKTYDFDPVDCSASNATHQVAINLAAVNKKDCGGTDYYAYGHGSKSKGAPTLLCLTHNVKQGDCLQRLKPTKRQSNKGELVRASCGSASESKVTKVVAEHKAACAKDETVITYPQPAQTICLGKP